MASVENLDLEGVLKLDEDLPGLISKQADREKLVRLVRRNVEDVRELFKGFKKEEMRASSKPLSSLERAALDGLVVNVRSVNSYLFLRCVSVILTDIRKVILIVEDHQRGTCVCIIYNHVFVSETENEFHNKSIFIVKEPRLQQFKDETHVLVVYNPTDLVRITRHHYLFQESAKLGWINTRKDPVTAHGWRNVGLNAFHAGKYDVAIEAFLMGLKIEPESEICWKLHLDLVLTYYKTAFFELCLKHVPFVLQVKPYNEKCLLHAGLSHCELRQYENAQQFYQILLGNNPAHKEAILQMEHCKERIREQNGSINVSNLFELDQANYFACMDFGTFVGPVEIVSEVDKKENSLVAKEDIKPGTLVLAEKAVVADMIDNSRETLGQKYTDIGGILAKTLSIIYKNPVTFGKLLRLPCESAHKASEIGLFCNGEDDSELSLDVPKVISIINTNQFLKRSRKGGTRHSLLHYFSSFVSHSCLPNSSLFIYNDVMLTRTATFVQKGEEITIAYRIHLGPRFEGFSVRGTICNCAYCNLELKDSRDVKQLRLDILKRVSSLKFSIFGNAENLEKLCGIISDLEKTYEGRDNYKTMLFSPYLKLAEVQCLNSNDSKRMLMLFDNALNCLGLSTDDLLRCAGDENSYLPKDAMLADEDLLYEVAMKIMSAYTKPSEINKWIQVLLMLERVFTGGDLEMLLKRFPQVALFVPTKLSYTPRATYSGY